MHFLMRQVTSDTLYVRKYIFALLLIAIPLCLSSCVKQSDYDALMQENAELTAQVAELTQQKDELTKLQKANEPEKTVTARVTGGITLSVLYVIPDVVLDNKTPKYAVVTAFQSPPFIISMDSELAKQINAGDQKFFIPDQTYTKEILVSQIGKSATTPPSFGDARNPAESEIGLCSNQLLWEEVND